MRGAGFGLIGLLICGGIIFYLMWGGPGNPGYVRPAMEAKKDATEMTNSISGRDEKGQNVTESIKYETNAKGILVKSVVSGGALEKKFGLKAGDLITEIGPITADQFGGSDGSARDFMMAQYGRPDEWTVIRNGQKIRLPSDRNVPSVTTAKPPEQPKPAQPAEKKPEESAAKPEEQPNPQQPIKSNTAKGQALDIVKQLDQGGK